MYPSFVRRRVDDEGNKELQEEKLLTKTNTDTEPQRNHAGVGRHKQKLENTRRKASRKGRNYNKPKGTIFPPGASNTHTNTNAATPKLDRPRRRGRPRKRNAIPTSV